MRLIMCIKCMLLFHIKVSQGHMVHALFFRYVIDRKINKTIKSFWFIIFLFIHVIDWIFHECPRLLINIFVGDKGVFVTCIMLQVILVLILILIFFREKV